MQIFDVVNLHTKTKTKTKTASGVIKSPTESTDYTDFASRFALAPPGCVHSASRVLFLRMATRVYDACSVNFVESVGDNKRSAMVSSRA